MSLPIESDIANRVQVSNSSKRIVSSSVTDTELAYLSGCLSNIQTQLNGKALSSHTHVKADVTDFTHSHVLADVSNVPTPQTGKYLKYDGSAYVWDTPTTGGGTGYTSGAENSLLWMIINADVIFTDDKILTASTYTDKAIQARGSTIPGVTSGAGICLARDNLDGTQDPNTSESAYCNTLQVGASNADHTLYKIVSGSSTLLGTENADLAAGGHYPMKLSCVGTTIKSYRGTNWYSADVATTPQISVTDSAISSGRYGIDNYARTFVSSTGANTYLNTLAATARLMAASSPAREPAGYYEVPVIGSGTMEDPYRADVPRGVDYSAVIKTGGDGKPVHYTAVVRVFAGKITGGKRLAQESAIREAKHLDDLLQDWDFRRMDKSLLKDVAAFRRSNMGVEQSEAELAHLLEDAKGW